MDPRLQQGAKSGSIDELYSLIDENPYILENIDAVPFINTPLHVAAASGNIEFAMEMLNLKPSFARKLNTSGYSPLHLAVDKGHADFVSWMLKHDHSLACVKGRNGMTPFHSLVVRGNVDLVAECLNVSPECIEDVSVNGRNALHLAVVTDRFEVLQVLTGWIQRTRQRKALKNEFRFLNKEDFSYNTALHLAAHKNDLQACFSFSSAFHSIPAIKLSKSGLTTYQTGLQPPGGGHPSKDPTKQAFFVLLWLSNTLGFYCSLFYTFSFLPLRVDENPYILHNINAVPFVNTPLHVAAASGNIPFSTEMLNLKASFATKLNTSGYSPLHLAVQKDHTDFITWLLGIDPELSRVKGREGITPFHLIVVRGDANLVAECLISSPECIQDVTVNGQNALHLALTNGRYETLQVLTGWIQRMSQRDSASTESDILNKKDAIKLLLECQLVKPNEVNGDGLTFLDILRHQGQIRDLELEQAVLKTGCKETTSLPKLEKTTSDHYKTPITFWSYFSTGIKRLKSDTSEEGRAVFLIICTLIITSTYQTALHPPGGLRQSEDGSDETDILHCTMGFQHYRLLLRFALHVLSLTS
ncbi:hypothetical protein DY000_02057683 [Brassica cretica]|uniref:PGG domain-containing protein n=1 Tax=Brassica cretica TaxID=69181 RepID=A0ABQ7AMK1_BRACR|nr:hypothetical protein DY000_02057683 [Brassica cretica]